MHKNARVAVTLASAGRSTGFSRFFDHLPSMLPIAWITELNQLFLRYHAKACTCSLKSRLKPAERPAEASATKTAKDL
jgi:hypothetical protein